MLVRLTTNDFSFLGGPKVDAATDNLCHYVASSYTTLKLAFEQDTLPAFSGIAQKLIEQHNYLAGIRKDHRMQDLIWNRAINWTLGDVYNTAESAYCAPTLSRASIRARVGYPDIHSRLNINFKRLDVIVHEAACNPATSDPFGEDSGGHLVLEGMTFTGKMERDRYQIFEPEGIWITRNFFHFIPDYPIPDTRLQFHPDKQVNHQGQCRHDACYDSCPGRNEGGGRILEGGEESLRAGTRKKQSRRRLVRKD